MPCAGRVGVLGWAVMLCKALEGELKRADTQEELQHIKLAEKVWKIRQVVAIQSLECSFRVLDSDFSFMLLPKRQPLGLEGPKVLDRNNFGIAVACHSVGYT